MGQVIASSLTRFDTLLALCKSLLEEGSTVGVSVSGQGNHQSMITLQNLAAGVVMKIWELLILIPTQPDMLKHVEELCTKGASASTLDWLAMLSEDRLVSISRITYTLQIIDNILQPAPEFRTLEVIEQAERFRAGTKGCLIVNLRSLTHIPYYSPFITPLPSHPTTYTIIEHITSYSSSYSSSYLTL